MQTQFDYAIRTVSLPNLQAMCERISGTCHRFAVTKVSRSRVHVEYSNPDEYGNESPMTAVFACYPSGFGPENIAIPMEILRVINDSEDGEGWQNFEPLTGCEPLYAKLDNKKFHSWRTKEEIEASK